MLASDGEYIVFVVKAHEESGKVEIILPKSVPEKQWTTLGKPLRLDKSYMKHFQAGNQAVLMSIHPSIHWPLSSTPPPLILVSVSFCIISGESRDEFISSKCMPTVLSEKAVLSVEACSLCSGSTFRSTVVSVGDKKCLHLDG